MKALIFVAAAIFAVACTDNASADFTRDVPDVVKPVKAVIAAIQSHNASSVAGLYSPDAVIVDDQRPFEWTGADAGSQWFSDVSQWSKWSPKIARFKGVPANVNIATDHAYVVVAGMFSSADPKKPWKQAGTLTFTLRKSGGSWKISSQVWAQTPYFPGRPPRI